MALDRTAACQSWMCFPCCKSCVYGICAFVLRCFFSCSQTVLQMEHSLGVKQIFFPPLSPHVKAVFFLIPCLPVLSTPLSYVCCVCMDRLMANFACTSDNKGLLLLLLLLLTIISEVLRFFLKHVNLFSIYKLRFTAKFWSNFHIGLNKNGRQAE